MHLLCNKQKMDDLAAEAVGLGPHVELRAGIFPFGRQGNHETGCGCKPRQGHMGTGVVL